MHACRSTLEDPTHDHEHECADSFDKLLLDVKTIGWHVILVRADGEGPGFGYTIGVHHTFKHPEIVMIGLRLEVMYPVLNGIVDKVKKGTQFEPERRYSGIIEKYDCVFRPVHRSHYDGYLGQAIRFYEGSDFPVLQCIWPDMDGRFSWEESSNPHLGRQQPVLDTPWPFKDPRNVAVFTTRQVLDEERPIVFVTHDEEDGGWQFLCDTPIRESKDARIVGLDCMFARDRTIGEVADLPIGWRAWREGPGSPWMREREEPDDNEEK